MSLVDAAGIVTVFDCAIKMLHPDFHPPDVLLVFFMSRKFCTLPLPPQKKLSQVESHPEHAHLSKVLTCAVLSTCIVSAHYLLAKTESFLEMVLHRWADR